MTTITLPPEIEKPLLKEAEKRGTTPEVLAVDYLRAVLVSYDEKTSEGDNRTLSDFLSGYIGTVNGTNETLSENGGDYFLEGLLEKQKRENL